MTTTTSATSSTSAQDIYATLNKKTATTTSTTDETQSTFLKLLTTQLQNQDPMNPVDNAQTTSQLAQISTVDGITKLNSTLEKLMGSYQSTETLQAAQLVGSAVMVEGSGLTLYKSAAVGGVDLSSAADNVSVSIVDSNGLEVKRMDLGKLSAGSHEFVWDGNAENGTVSADGNYTIKVTATQGGEKVTSTPLQLATVNGVVTGGSSVQLDLGSLGKVATSDVKLFLN